MEAVHAAEWNYFKVERNGGLMFLPRRVVEKDVVGWRSQMA